MSVSWTSNVNGQSLWESLRESYRNYCNRVESRRKPGHGNELRQEHSLVPKLQLQTMEKSFRFSFRFFTFVSQVMYNVRFEKLWNQIGTKSTRMARQCTLRYNIHTRYIHGIASLFALRIPRRRANRRSMDEDELALESSKCLENA